MSKSANGRKVKIVSINEYIHEAAKLARYEWCDDVKQWAAMLDELSFCWAQADTLEETRDQLLEVIEGWIIVGLQHDDEIPVINGMCIGYERPKSREVERAAPKASQRHHAPTPKRKKVLAGAAR